MARLLPCLLLLITCGPKVPGPGGGGDSGEPPSDDTGTPDTGIPDTGTPDSGRDTQTDTGSADTAGDTAGDFCADAADMTWETFGRGFLTGNCNGCHAATAVDRHGAPEYATFDTVEEAWTWATSILILATWYDGDEPVMPPQGGVSDDDRTRLEWWLRCAEPGT